MPRLTIPFVGANQQGRFSQTADQLTVNMYPQIESEGAKSRIGLYSDAGKTKIASIVGDVQCRSNGVIWKPQNTKEEQLYFVFSNKFYCLTKDFLITEIGTLQASSDRVSLAAGISAIGLVDGITGYYYDGTTFAEITDVDFPSNPTHIAWLKQFFIVNSENTGKFYSSAAGDITSWNALDFKNAEANPDDVKGIAATENVLYIVGSVTLQAYYTSGNLDFPFDLFNEGVIAIGLAAPHSLVASSAGLFFLGRHKEGGISPMQLQGFTPAIIGDPYIDFQINEILQAGKKIDDAIGFVYKQAGHWFYELTFPDAAKTFVYMPGSGFWFERRTPGLTRNRSAGYGYLNNTHIVGDYASGNIFKLDLTTVKDNGVGLYRIRRSQNIHQDGRRITFHSFYLDCVTGMGDVDIPNPIVTLRFSDDGGKTWSYDLQESLGPEGEFFRKVAWHKLGISRNRIFEIEVTDPVQLGIFNAYAEISLDDFS